MNTKKLSNSYILLIMSIFFTQSHAKNSIDTIGTDGQTALTRSIEIGNLKEAIRLIEQDKANINAKNRLGETPLLVATSNNNLKITRFLLSKNADVNIANTITEYTPLLWATFHDNLEMVKLLLQHNAHVNVKDKTGKTPLLFATNNNNLEITTLLLEKGANSNPKNKLGVSPLLFAAAHNNLEMVKLLIDNKANTNAKNNATGNTSLLFAAAHNNADMVKFLVEHDANINVKNKKNETPLLFAIQKNNVSMIEYLINKGAKPLRKGFEELVAASAQSLSFITKNMKLDINMKNKQGLTPLMEKIQMQAQPPLSKNKVQALEQYINESLDLGANIKAQDKEGNTIITLAAQASQPTKTKPSPQDIKRINELLTYLRKRINESKKL